MKHVHGLFSLFAAACLMAAGPVQAADPSPVVLTDAEVLGVLTIANGAEVSSGEVAVTKGQKQEVKDFGTKMVADHTANNLRIEAVELKSGITRAESDASRQLKTDTDKMIGPYRRDTLHFIPETSFTLFGTQKDRPLVQL